jgi:hypothetical protein
MGRAASASVARSVQESGRHRNEAQSIGRRSGRGGGSITIGGAQVIVQGNADPKVAAMIAAGIRENNKTILSQVESQRRRQA